MTELTSLLDEQKYTSMFRSVLLGGDRVFRNRILRQGVLEQRKNIRKGFCKRRDRSLKLNQTICVSDIVITLILF